MGEKRVYAMEQTREDERWMMEALELAKLAEEAGDVPVGALVVRDGRVLGRGFNRREAACDPTAHAEVLALREAAETDGIWRLDGATLYVTLEPCPMCAGAIVNSRIARLVFGAMDPKGGACGSLFDIPSDPAREPPRADNIGRHGRGERRNVARFFRGAPPHRPRGEAGRALMR